MPIRNVRKSKREKLGGSCASGCSQTSMYKLASDECFQPSLRSVCLFIRDEAAVDPQSCGDCLTARRLRISAPRSKARLPSTHHIASVEICQKSSKCECCISHTLVGHRHNSAGQGLALFAAPSKAEVVRSLLFSCADVDRAGLDGDMLEGRLVRKDAN